MKLPVSAQNCLLAASCTLSRSELRCLNIRRIQQLEKLYVRKLKMIKSLAPEKHSQAYKKLIKLYTQRLKTTVLCANRPRVALSAKACIDTITNAYVNDIMQKITNLMHHDGSNTLMQRHLEYVVCDKALKSDVAIDELRNALEVSK